MDKEENENFRKLLQQMEEVVGKEKMEEIKEEALKDFPSHLQREKTEEEKKRDEQRDGILLGLGCLLLGEKNIHEMIGDF